MSQCGSDLSWEKSNVSWTCCHMSRFGVGFEIPGHWIDRSLVGPIQIPTTLRI